MKQQPSSLAVSFFLLAVLFFCGCRAINPVVQNDYDRNATFGNYRTFAWFPVDAAAGTAATPAYSPLIDQRVKAAVESELLKRGLIPATTSPPDLLLAYDIAVTPPADLPDEASFVPGFGYGYGYWYGYRYNYNYAGIASFQNVQRYPAGTLLIDFIDPSSNELVWRGWTASRINVTGIGESKISKSVARIISQYPPGSGLQNGIYHQGR